jgi:hypothetical protein
MAMARGIRSALGALALATAPGGCFSEANDGEDGASAASPSTGTAVDDAMVGDGAPTGEAATSSATGQATEGVDATGNPGTSRWRPDPPPRRTRACPSVSTACS